MKSTPSLDPALDRTLFTVTTMSKPPWLGLGGEGEEKLLKRRNLGQTLQVSAFSNPAFVICLDQLGGRGGERERLMNNINPIMNKRQSLKPRGAA